MRRVSDGVGQDQRPARTEVGVGGIELRLVERRKVVGDLHAPAVGVWDQLGAGRIVHDLYEGVAVVGVGGEALAVDGVGEGAVAGLEVERALRVEDQRAAALPDPAQAAVGRGVQHAVEDHRGPGIERRFVTQDPAVVGPVVAVGGEGDASGASR